MPFITNTPERLKRARESRRRHYYKNRKQYADRIRGRKKENISYIIAIKQESVCADCKMNDWRCLEFDHLPGYKKEAAISSPYCMSWSREKIDKELSKCEVVCGNCHKIRTYERRKRPRGA